MQRRLFLWMYMSQTLVWKHNYEERGTFKIDSIFILLVVSPGSLHMNMSTENIDCVHRVY